MVGATSASALGPVPAGVAFSSLSSAACNSCSSRIRSGSSARRPCRRPDSWSSCSFSCLVSATFFSSSLSSSSSLAIVASGGTSILTEAGAAESSARLLQVLVRFVRPVRPGRVLSCKVSRHGQLAQRFLQDAAHFGARGIVEIRQLIHFLQTPLNGLDRQRLAVGRRWHLFGRHSRWLCRPVAQLPAPARARPRATCTVD